MRICYVTYPSRVPWDSNFTAEALKRYSRHEIIEASPTQAFEIDCDLYHFHNIQLLKRLKILKKGRPIIAGIRGIKGLEVLRDIDAISVDIDAKLQSICKRLHPEVYVLPEGIDTTLFKPASNARCEILRGFVGRDHKPFKNYALFKRLPYPHIKATYNRYIPHDEMPKFYNKVILLNLSEHEGFCRPVAEAAACGRPAISTNMGVAPYILDPAWIIDDPRDLKTVCELIELERQIIIPRSGRMQSGKGADFRVGEDRTKVRSLLRRDRYKILDNLGKPRKRSTA